MKPELKKSLSLLCLIITYSFPTTQLRVTSGDFCMGEDTWGRTQGVLGLGMVIDGQSQCRNVILKGQTPGTLPLELWYHRNSCGTITPNRYRYKAEISWGS